MFAVKNRQTDAVKILLEAGADPRRKTIKGLSAFDLASRSKQEQVFEILTAKLELSTVGKENRL
jgi:ankyrin repeat protein